VPFLLGKEPGRKETLDRPSVLRGGESLIYFGAPYQRVRRGIASIGGRGGGEGSGMKSGEPGTTEKGKKSRLPLRETGDMD